MADESSIKDNLGSY